MKRLVSFIMVVLFISGCASMPKREIENSRIYNASYDEVWEAAIKAVAKHGDSISVAEKDSGLIAINGLHEQNIFKYVHFTLGAVARIVNVIVTKADKNSCLVIVNMSIMGSYSKGVLEKEYLDTIQRLLSNNS